MQSNLFKNLYNENYIELLATSIKTSYLEFNSNVFTKTVFDDSWKEKELKQRMRHIAETMRTFLPNEYANSIEILTSAFSVIGTGYTLENMIFQDFVELFGMDDFETSIVALEHFTIGSSSEFAIRRFIIKYPQRTMQQMKKWAYSENEHVRRLASEGCRPRLPWAIALQEFKIDPTTVIEILEILKDDSSEYVRKSVANNLNDISKDNPEIVKKLAKKWLGENDTRDKVVKYGCRTLLKESDRFTLNLFEYTEPKNINIENISIPKAVNFGEELEFSFSIFSKEDLGKVRLEFAIEFLRKNDNYSKKVFKISEGDFKLKRKKIIKKYSFKKITTRNYYSGKHKLYLIINGDIFHKQEFILESF